MQWNEQVVQGEVKIGFVEEGEPFAIEGRPHQRMVFPKGASLSGCCGHQP